MPGESDTGELDDGEKIIGLRGHSYNLWIRARLGARSVPFSTIRVTERRAEIKNQGLGNTVNVTSS